MNSGPAIIFYIIIIIMITLILKNSDALIKVSRFFNVVLASSITALEGK